MPDRIIRDELLESERWVDLPSDTDRLVFVGLLFRCDDFGNLEGGQRRMFRFLHSFSQIKTPEAAAATLLHLADADLLRRYEANGREFFHIPRLRPHRQYLVRKFPASPWDDDRKLGKEQRVVTRGLAKNQPLGEKVADTSQTRRMHVAQGVGVGVGVGVGETIPPNPPKGGKDVKPKRDVKNAAPVSFARFEANCEAKGEKPIPEDDAVWEFADRSKISLELMRLHYRAFRDAYADGSKRYTDWRRVFRTSVKRNWYKVWYFEGDHAEISRHGQMLDAGLPKKVKLNAAA